MRLLWQCCSQYQYHKGKLYVEHGSLLNPVLAVVEKYKHHQSIISINKKMREKGLPKFSFHLVTLEETFKEVALLSDKKASQASDIPVKIIKENRDLIAYFMLLNFNNALSCSEYPASLPSRYYTNLQKG